MTKVVIVPIFLFFGAVSLALYIIKSRSTAAPDMNFDNGKIVGKKFFKIPQDLKEISWNSPIPLSNTTNLLMTHSLPLSAWQIKSVVVKNAESGVESRVEGAKNVFNSLCNDSAGTRLNLTDSEVKKLHFIVRYIVRCV